jgi:carboxylesterase
MSDYPIMSGAEPWSYGHDVAGSAGALVIHGFTGNPGSMRGLAEAFAKGGFHVEMPRLPGHGTALEDMLTTRWSDWAGEAEAAYQRLAQRADRIVVAGLSMGGALTLRIGADHPEVRGLVCINPATRPVAADMIDAVRQMLQAGTDVMPGIGSDIADPESRENAYEGTPLEPLLSLVDDGLEPLQHVYPTMRMPLLLLSSPQDHVVEPAQSDFLEATYGGPVERILLERSYHVATQDYDKDLIFEKSVEFARRVTS